MKSPWQGVCGGKRTIGRKLSGMIRSRAPERGRLPSFTGDDTYDSKAIGRSRTREAVARPIVIALVIAGVFALILWHLAAYLATDAPHTTSGPGSDPVAKKRLHNAYLGPKKSFNDAGATAKGPQAQMLAALASLSARLDTEAGLPLTLPVAGLPRFPRLFARDALIAGLVMDDAQTLHEALYFAGLNQGTARDAITGEEPGKVCSSMKLVSFTTASIEETTVSSLVGEMLRKLAAAFCR